MAQDDITFRMKPVPRRSHPLQACALFGTLLLAPGVALAQPYDVPPTWGGDIWSRPRLTGDWGGFRDEMAQNGVEFDVDLLSNTQGDISGGRSTGSDAWNNADYTLNLDTGKAGLWPGGFFNVQADSGFGHILYSNVGAIVPVNTAALLPDFGKPNTALMNAMFWQFLSTKFGLFTGKIDTFSLATTEFYGNYNTQFVNAAFAFPMTSAQVPISAFGGGIVGLPTSDITLSAMAIDPSGTPTNNDIGTAFNDGAMVLVNGSITVRPFGLVGHQSAGFAWSDKNRLSLEQDPSNIGRLLLFDTFPRLGDPGPLLTVFLRRFFPGLLVPTEPLNRMDSSWSVSYAFDQYFWQPDRDPKHGVGVFFSFGASDGNPNPIQYSFFGGIGGKGVTAGRPDDSFGVGVAHTVISDEFLPYLRQRLSLGLEQENAFEAYYNAALTKWLSATADFQLIDQGIGKMITAERPYLAYVNTAVVTGVRLRVRF